MSSMSLRGLQLANAGRRFEKAAEVGIARPRKDWHFKLFKNPPENMAAIAQAGMRKSMMTPTKLAALGIMAGIYVGFGACIAAMVGGGLELEFAQRFPGIQKLLAGLVFPISLVLIFIAGGELFTGNVMLMVVGILAGTTKVWRACIVLLFSLITNYIGTALVAGLSIHFAGFMTKDPWKTYLLNLAQSKVSPGFGELMLRAIPANMLVNLALILAFAAEDITGKIVSLYICISCFAIIGFEHLIANEAYMHFAFFNAPGVPYGLWLWKNFLAVLIGNLVGGAVIGTVYWYVYLDNTMPTRVKWLINFDCCFRPRSKKSKPAPPSQEPGPVPTTIDGRPKGQLKKPPPPTGANANEPA